MSDFTAYLAAEGFVAELTAELGETLAIHDRLVLAAGPPRPAAWAANVWLAPERVAIASINDAVRTLRARQRNWACYPFQLHRRCALIADKLPRFAPAPLPFPSPLPTAPLGSWTLLDANTLLLSGQCSSPFPHGEVSFAEDKVNPPSRAYLKLWETFTRTQLWPRPGELCLDLGASPGGWTWVLQQLGARVIAVDKAPLAPHIAALPQVSLRQESAFAVTPESIGPVDWLFSDVICYPQRLLHHVERWRAAGLARHYVCTLKFQGATDHATAQAFAAIPGSRLFHLHHNHHELTWVCHAEPAAG
jgi:23S rRNA (cytidine2498-2'-O)-methyltransferase